MLVDIGIHKADIGDVLFAPQIPDVVLPSSSQIRHKKLNLASNTLVFDINLGCSGYTSGILTISSLMKSPDLKYGLLLVGDTLSKKTDPKDKATALLLSDGGSATMLENDSVSSMYYDFRIDGERCENLIVRDGLARRNHVGNPCLYMYGLEIYDFAVNKVCESLKSFQSFLDSKGEAPDFYLLHKANIFLLKALRKNMGIKEQRFKINIDKYAHTSSISIPLLLSDLSQEIKGKDSRVLLSGLSVGYSWWSLFLTLCSSFNIAEVTYYE